MAFFEKADDAPDGPLTLSVPGVEGDWVINDGQALEAVGPIATDLTACPLVSEVQGPDPRPDTIVEPVVTIESRDPEDVEAEKRASVAELGEDAVTPPLQPISFGPAPKPPKGEETD